MSAIVNNLACRIDAPRETVVAALERLDPFATLHAALDVMGGSGLIATHRTARTPSSEAGTCPLELSWPLPDGDRLTATWTARVTGAGNAAALLTVCVRVTADDAASGTAAAAWPLIGPIIESQTKRLMRTVVDMAEEDFVR